MLRRLFILAWALLLPAAGLAAEKPSLEIQNAWSRATAPGARNGAVFFTIANAGAADRLVGAAATAAAKAELHESAMQGGLMTMRAVTVVDVPANGTVEFKPGGLHVMLIGLKEPLAAGQSIPLTLTFEKAGAVDVTVAVKAGAPGNTGMSH